MINKPGKGLLGLCLEWDYPNTNAKVHFIIFELNY